MEEQAVRANVREVLQAGTVPNRRPDRTLTLSTTNTLDAVIPVLHKHRGQKYCAPCLAKATGIVDANEVRRVRDRARELPDLVVVQDACDTCHTVRRTLSTPR